jgi:hypothetical protein
MDTEKVKISFLEIIPKSYKLLFKNKLFILFSLIFALTNYYYNIKIIFNIKINYFIDLLIMLFTLLLSLFIELNIIFLIKDSFENNTKSFLSYINLSFKSFSKFIKANILLLFTFVLPYFLIIIILSFAFSFIQFNPPELLKVAPEHSKFIFSIFISVVITFIFIFPKYMALPIYAVFNQDKKKYFSDYNLFSKGYYFDFFKLVIILFLCILPNILLNTFFKENLLIKYNFISIIWPYFIFIPFNMLLYSIYDKINKGSHNY